MTLANNMAKDYAKYSIKKHKPNKENRQRILFFIILALTIITTTYSCIYIKKHHPRWVATIQNFYHPKPAIKSVNKLAEEQEDIHFDFYNDLPNMQLASPHGKVIIQEKPENYTIKIAEFQNQNEASQMRLSLLLDGIKAEIVKRGEKYRIQQGNFTDLAQAKSSQKVLEKLGVKSVIASRE